MKLDPPVEDEQEDQRRVHTALDQGMRQGNSMKKHPMVTVMPIPKMKLVAASMSSKIIGEPPARLNSSMAHP